MAGWKRLAHVETTNDTTVSLDTANDSSFSGNDFAAYNNLRVFITGAGSSSGTSDATDTHLKFNASSGTYYNYIEIYDGSNESKDESDDSFFNVMLRGGGSGTDADHYTTMDITNTSTDHKIIQGTQIRHGTTYPFVWRFDACWHQDAQITRIQLFGSTGGSNETGRLADKTRMTVYGMATDTVANKTSITDVPVGTRYEETDTRKIFHRRTQTGGAGGESWVEKGTALAASALRGLFGGGQPNSVLIDYIAIQTLGNAADFGDLITAREFPAACADSTRGVWAAGGNPYTTVIEYVTVATLGNAVDFGASTTGSARRELSGVADSTRGVFSGGTMSGGTETNTQDFITIQTTGTCTDFGDLSATRASMAGCASATRGVVAGGYNSSNAAQDWIDYFTIQTTGSASDAGNLMESVYATTGCSDLSRGIIAGGNAGGNTNRIQWITISSTANAQDFGDLTVARAGTAACADSTRGVIGGGYNHPPGHRVDTDYITCNRVKIIIC